MSQHHEIRSNFAFYQIILEGLARQEMNDKGFVAIDDFSLEPDSTNCPSIPEASAPPPPLPGTCDFQNGFCDFWTVEDKPAKWAAVNGQSFVETNGPEVDHYNSSNGQ